MSTPIKKFKSIKIVSDGTTAGTKITTAGGELLATVVGMKIFMDSKDPVARARLDVILPQLEIEIPAEQVEFELASKRYCPKCSKELGPNMYDLKGELFVSYKCEDCDWHKTYPFDFNWDNIPEELDAPEEEKE